MHYIKIIIESQSGPPSRPWKVKNKVRVYFDSSFVRDKELSNKCWSNIAKKPRTS